MYEHEQGELISAFREAGNGIHSWLPFLKPGEVKQLMQAAALIKQIKAAALERQQQKIA